jgi:hypothetical protein
MGFLYTNKAFRYIGFVGDCDSSEFSKKGNFIRMPLTVGSIFQGAAGAAVQYLGYTPGLFIVGLFAILILWMYANFLITGTLFIVGGKFSY